MKSYKNPEFSYDAGFPKQNESPKGQHFHADAEAELRLGLNSWEPSIISGECMGEVMDRYLAYDYTDRYTPERYS